MHHLSLEFSIEIILAFVEFTQFLKLLQNKLIKLEQSNIKSRNQNSKNSKNNKNNGVNENMNGLNFDSENLNLSVNLPVENESDFASIADEMKSRNKRIYNNPMDSILFSHFDNDFTNMKMYNLAESIPVSLIIYQNVKNIHYCKRRIRRLTFKGQLTKLHCPIIITTIVENEYHNLLRDSDIIIKINKLLIEICSFYCICFEFYHKYIKTESEFPINIDSNLIQRHTQLFESFNIIQILTNSDEKNDNINTPPDDHPRYPNTFYTYAPRNRKPTSPRDRSSSKKNGNDIQSNNPVQLKIDKIEATMKRFRLKTRGNHNNHHHKSSTNLTNLNSVNSNGSSSNNKSSNNHGSKAGMSDESAWDFLVNPTTLDDMITNVSQFTFNRNADDTDSDSDDIITTDDTEDIGDSDEEKPSVKFGSSLRKKSKSKESHREKVKDKENDKENDKEKEKEKEKKEKEREKQKEKEKEKEEQSKKQSIPSKVSLQQLRQMDSADHSIMMDIAENDKNDDKNDRLESVILSPYKRNGKDKTGTNRNTHVSRMIFEISVHELCWLLLKKQFKHNEKADRATIHLVLKQLKMNYIAFLLLICKIFRKTNDELLTLLFYSFQRLKQTNEYERFINTQT